MPKFVHIVQVHPIVQGILQTHKVKHEAEFQFHDDALAYVKQQNRMFEKAGDALEAVYLGCVNDETGELL
jgi:hypothetical protein